MWSLGSHIHPCMIYRVTHYSVLSRVATTACSHSTSAPTVTGPFSSSRCYLLFSSMWANSIAIIANEMELYTDLVPLTAENFRALYTKKPLHYKGLCLSQHYLRIHVEGRRLRQGPRHRRRVHLRRHLPNENFLLPHDRPWLPNGSAENKISQFFTRVP